MKNFRWNEEKNRFLRQERGLSFEDVITQINENKIIEIIAHPNQEKYPNQNIYIVELFGYICMVPFIVNEAEIFLKIIIPSRKLHKHYKEQS